MSESDDLTRHIKELEAENRGLKTALEMSYDITLECLGNALGLKAASTQDHSKRVTGFSIGIARAMGIRGIG